MKKIMMTLAAVLCCAMTTTVFTACGSDDDDKSEPASNKPVAAVMDFTLSVSDDMVDKANLTVEYYDANGKVQTETLTKKDWTKSVQAKLPATFGIRLMVKAKEGVDYASLEKFTESYTYSYSVYPVNASGTVLEGGKSGNSHSSLDIPGSKVAEWIADKSGGILKILYTVDANGQVTSGNWQ
jgi:methionine-rich copper-binding protein CopC